MVSYLKGRTVLLHADQALVECPAVSAGLLERLDLADNTLGEEGGQALAEALSSQPYLTYVNLRDCELEVRKQTVLFFLSFVGTAGGKY